MHYLFRISVLSVIFFNFSNLLADISYDFTEGSNGVNKKERLDQSEKKIDAIHSQLSIFQSELSKVTSKASEIDDLKLKWQKLNEELSNFKLNYQRDKELSEKAEKSKSPYDPNIQEKSRVLTNLDLIELQNENNRLKESLKSVRNENEIIRNEIKEILLKINGTNQNKLGK